MCSEQKFFICETCGNLVGMIQSGGVPIFCCGKPMKELVPNTTDAAVEKHVPVIEVDGNNVTVKVSSTTHPMTKEHHIAWVYLMTEQGGQRKCLAVDGEPVVKFALNDDDKVISVYAYCNLHGLWKAEL